MAKESGFDFDNVVFNTRLVHDLDGTEIAATRRILAAAMLGALPHGRAGQYVEQLREESSQAYVLGRRHPEHSFPGNSYRGVRLTRAWERQAGGQYTLAGYLYSADNTSGGPLTRQLKMHAPVGMPKFGGKRYVHLRELAVEPSQQRRGLAHGLAYEALSHYDVQQPVSAYIWPTELPKMPAALATVGMHPEGETDPQHIYGENRPAVAQERWLGEVGVMRQAILELPGFVQAFKTAP